ALTVPLEAFVMCVLMIALVLALFSA
ncbi:DUF1196 domain-containing protein, partial [Vibrio cholerae]|nr:DUF1196 domain-containing protein [Vibrio cholerae]MVD21439.1 DUF1196 domain-containing protein [Vibrio cholerae]MVD33366.1 DUF1196 domain-containing protein [Vibrio cholerae]MVD44688.1 DUF1196 domain-containing protein [Vibrio cholerae]MVF01476.1 DUF1196 domain-containing protein [Vibrio cholerae]